MSTIARLAHIHVQMMLPRDLLKQPATLCCVQGDCLQELCSKIQALPKMEACANIYYNISHFSLLLSKGSHLQYRFVKCRGLCECSEWYNSPLPRRCVVWEHVEDNVPCWLASKEKRFYIIFYWITYKTNKTSLLVAAANVLNIIRPAHFSSSKL